MLLTLIVVTPCSINLYCSCLINQSQSEREISDDNKDTVLFLYNNLKKKTLNIFFTTQLSRQL